MYTNFKDWKKANVNLKIAGRDWRKSLQVHVNQSVRFFIGEGSKQIAILQGVMDIAMAGLSNNDVMKLAGYLQAAVPQHKIEIKRKGKQIISAKVLAKESKDVRYRPAKTTKFVDTNPVWHEWGKQSSSAETPDYAGVFRAAAMLRKALEKGNYELGEHDLKTLVLEA